MYRKPWEHLIYWAWWVATTDFLEAVTSKRDITANQGLSKRKRRKLCQDKAMEWQTQSCINRKPGVFRNDKSSVLLAQRGHNRDVS